LQAGDALTVAGGGFARFAQLLGAFDRFTFPPIAATPQAGHFVHGQSNHKSTGFATLFLTVAENASPF
jgi:hypothetical protein